MLSNMNVASGEKGQVEMPLGCSGPPPVSHSSWQKIQKYARIQTQIQNSAKNAHELIQFERCTYNIIQFRKYINKKTA